MLNQDADRRASLAVEGHDQRLSAGRLLPAAIVPITTPSTLTSLPILVLSDSADADLSSMWTTSSVRRRW